MAIHINVEKLISGKIVENERIEYKRDWNPVSVYRTICAFANDYENIGGGYIVVGAEESKGRAKRPLSGISIDKLDAIQKEMIGYNHHIRPFYVPKIGIETIDGVMILVIWVPGGNMRPYEVPENIKAKNKLYHYYIRRYASTVQANKDERDELISLTRQTPFDDRINTQASIENISPLLVKEYLQNVGSALLEQIETAPLKDIYKAMDLVSGPDELLYPKNIALMMFNHRPEKFFPYSRIEIVEFPNGLGDPEFFEKPAITGPVYVQIQQALLQLQSIALKERIYKNKDRPESDRAWNYPYRALEESIANALYHRSWEIREPVEIRILPDCIEIVNQGGPDRSVKMNEIQKGIVYNRRYRNRRIGDFLKELDITEGRGTGIPIIRKEMAKNGSPEPRFETDENYSYFITRLPIHPAFLSDEGIFYDVGINDGINDDDGGINDINGGISDYDGGINNDDGGINDNDGGLNDDNGGINNDNGGLNDSDGGINDINGGINNSDGGINDNDGGLNDDNGGINDSDGGINNDNGGLNDSDGGINDINGGINNSDGGLNDYDGGINNDNGGINNDNGWINDINGGLIDNDGGINNIDGGINDNNGGLNAIDGGINDNNGGLNAIDGGINDDNGGLNNIDGGLNNIDGGINDIDGGINDSDGGLNNENGGLNNIDGGINDIDGGINDNDGGINDNDGGLNDDNGGINDDNGGLNDINGGINNIDGGLKNDWIKKIVSIIVNEPGLSVGEITTRIKKSQRTIERYLQILRNKEIVEYKGSKKTGGYYLTKKTKNKLKKIIK